MKKLIGFKCSQCGSEFDIDEVSYVCPKDGGNLDTILDYRSIKANYTSLDSLISSEGSMWRYLPLLPINDPGFTETPLRSVGWTPVFRSKRTSDYFQHENLWFKDESKNPTASLKDRASALVVSIARNLQVETVVTASTGNAGAALAGMAAAVGQKSVILAPRKAPIAKITQLLIYGSQVILIDGTYDDAFELSILASQEFGWYCRNTGYNPYTVEGKKTTAFEIWEFMRDHTPNQQKPSDWNIVIPVGDGNIISGIYKGFIDLIEIGILEGLPKLFGVQSEGSAAIANTILENRSEIFQIKANTIADSIAVDFPRDGYRAIRAMKKSLGLPVVVSDEEIIKSISKLGQVGIFTEPAGAASFAGYKKLLSNNLINSTEPTLLLLTGSGLKDITSASKAVKEAPIIEPSLGNLKKMVK